MSLTFLLTIVVPPVTPPVPALPKVNQNEREQCTRSPGTAIERTRRTCLRRSLSFDHRRASCHATRAGSPKGSNQHTGDFHPPTIPIPSIKVNSHVKPFIITTKHAP